jgi:hypothetical protein
VRGGIAAQESGKPTAIRDEPSCRRCIVRLTPITRLSVLDGPGAIASPRGLARDSKGRLFLTSAYFQGELKVYDSNGAYLRSLTTLGSGPGEARGVPKIVIASDDSIRVFDSRNSRYTVFAPDFRLARESRYPHAPYEIISLDPSTFAMSSPRQFGKSWHLIQLMRSTGDTLRSFGEPHESVSSTEQFFLWRRTCPGSGRLYLGCQKLRRVPNRTLEPVWAA